MYERNSDIHISEKLFEKGFIISFNIDYGILGGKWKRIVVNLISFFLIITLILKLHELL